MQDTRRAVRLHGRQTC